MLKTDVGAVADAVTTVVTVAEKIREEVHEHRQQQAFEDFQQRWNAAVAAGDVETLDRLLAERRSECGFRLPVSSPEAGLRSGDAPPPAA